MNNRKDSIYEIIVKYTRESILDNTFQFEHCNAFDIALELKIDRSNVSRLLNQMFHEYLLIKINGRPTTYLSREVIVNEFHYSKAPQIIDNKEQLREQLILNTPVGNTSSPDFKIVGSNMGESLKEIIDSDKFQNLLRSFTEDYESVPELCKTCDLLKARPILA